MSDFRSIPLKKPFEVDIVKPLKNVISIINSSLKTPRDYTSQINEFNKFRWPALWKAYEKRDGALEEIYAYYDQLNSLQKKIPEGELRVPFKWRNAFCKGGFLSKNSVVISNLGYEKACVLFNIAALQSFIASNQAMDNDEGLKLAAKLFQQSAGIFKYLKDEVVSNLPGELTSDLHPDTLTALTSFLLAQAQEVFVHKSRREQMKSEIIAKISNETSVLYGEALKAMQNPHVSHLWERETLTMVSGKQSLFQGMAEFHQSLECKDKSSMGEHIARLKTAIENLKVAMKGKLTKANELNAVAEQMLKDAIKDNDSIYHDKVPDRSSLTSIGRASLVKPHAIPDRFSREFRDLFGELVPAAVQQALASFENRKQDIVQSEVYKLREATQLLNGILASLNLPAAIDETFEQGLPQSLVTKSMTVQTHGGSEMLNRMLERLPDLQSRNTETLDEIEKTLNDEEKSDELLRQRFKEKWVRKQSSRLTLSFRANLDKYRRTINTAIQADKSVRKKYEENKSNIELLENGPAALAKAIPYANPTNANKDSQTVSRLRHLMKEVDFIKIERDSIEGQLKAVKGDMKESFLSALKNGNFNEDEVVEDGLTRLFNPIQQKIIHSLKSQERLLEEIQKANSQFSVERKEQDIAAKERENILKNLAAAYDAFMELSSNLEEGTKFYNDLTEVLILFQSKVADFCFARKTEKEELLRSLEKFVIKHGASSISADIGYPALNRSQQVSGASSSSNSTNPNLPYPAFPQHMPMPYGNIQLPPYAQYFMPPLPNVYYTMAPPPGYPPQQQDPKHLEKDQNPSSSSSH